MATVVRIFSTLDRHIVKQVAGPAALGFVTYTFLLMMRGLFSLVEQIFVRGLPAKDALAVLLATLPHVMVLTIPMGFLFGVLLGVGRMTNDNEIVALQAGGISVRRLLLPIVGLGLVLTIASGYLFTAVIPKGNRSLKDLRIRLFTSAKNLGRIEPQVFYDQFPNLMLYVEQVDPESGAWLNVLAHDSSSPGEERLILARRGRVVSAEAEGVGADTRSGFADDGMATDRQAAEPWIVLEEAVTHQFFRAKPDTYRVNNNQMQMFRPEIKGEGVIRYNLAMRERDTGDLVAFVRASPAVGHPFRVRGIRSARSAPGCRLSLGWQGSGIRAVDRRDSGVLHPEQQHRVARNRGEHPGVARDLAAQHLARAARDRPDVEDGTMARRA
jgi:hypothetical protein